MDVWYAERVAKEYDENINFYVLAMKAKVWIERTFDLLASTETIYEMSLKFLQTKRGCEVAFRNLINENDSKAESIEKMARIRKCFVTNLSYPHVQFGRLRRIIKELQPTRFFLFEVLNCEITRLSKSESDPADIKQHIELRAEYISILNLLCESCYLLVPKLAAEIKTDKLTPEDCVAYGNVGLVKAAHRFDFERIQEDSKNPVRFTTYARWWIRERIINAIERNTFFMSVDCKTRDAYYKSTKGLILDEGLIEEGSYAAYLTPLHDMNSNDEGSSFDDTIDNSYTIGTPIKDPEMAVSEKNWAEAASELFPTVLTDLEYKVLKYKFEVLNCSYEMDEASISKELRMSKTKVKGIIVSAIEKLQRNAQCVELIRALIIGSESVAV